MKKRMRNLITFVLVFALAAGFSLFLRVDYVQAKVKQLKVTESMVKKAVHNQKVKCTDISKKAFTLKKSTISDISIEEPEVNKKKASVEVAVVYTQKIGKEEYDLETVFKLNYKYKKNKWVLSGKPKALSTEVLEDDDYYDDDDYDDDDYDDDDYDDDDYDDDDYYEDWY